MLEDEYAVQRLLNTYSQTASRGDWDRAVASYLPDGVWSIPHLGMRFAGHAAIREALAGFFRVMDYVVQLNSPAVIDVAGDTASASSGIREAGKTRGKEEGFEFFGIYEDRLVRTAQGWRFAERVFQGLGTHYFPLMPSQA